MAKGRELLEATDHARSGRAGVVDRRRAAGKLERNGLAVVH
jgi:hypothetical protein